MAISDNHTLLPPQVEQNMEAIACAVHESWMQQRRSEGWVYADTNNFAKKQTQFMVPYDALPESEKEMDRVTVRQVVSSLIRLGYRIER